MARTPPSSLPPPPPPGDSGTLPWDEPSEDSSTDSDDDWAVNSVPWNPELPVFEPGDTLLPGAGSWSVPFSDFIPLDSPFALELRAETIEQLVGGDALRRGESERIEAGRSGANADLVAGRDRVHVHGRLDEHTGHGLAQQVAHLDTTVDGTLDVHAGMDDTVLLAGHMKDAWDGGTAIVAAVADDLVAGGGVRVTAPLDLWLHGVMGVEERIGTCTADAVLMELSATHYEREYGPGVHAVGLALYTGSLYQSTRSTFWPLMRVSSGVRNLIAGGGGGGAGGAPGASPPPAPAAGGAGTEAASTTLSTASGSARSVGAMVEAGADSEDLAGVHRFADASDAVHADEFTPTNPELVAQLDDLLAEISRWGDESGDLTELNRSADSADQLAALQREEIAQIDAMLNSIDQQILEIQEFVPPQPLGGVESAASPTVGGTDDLRHSGELGDAHPPTPGSDEAEQDLSRFGRFESVPSADGAELPEIPPDRGWVGNYKELTAKYMVYRRAGEWYPVLEFTRAVENIDSRIRDIYVKFGGNTADLTNLAGTEGTPRIFQLLEEMATRADEAGEAQRAAAIHEALEALDRLTYEIVTNLAERAYDFDGTSTWMAKYRRLDPAIDDLKLGNWVQEQLDARALNLGDPDVVEDPRAMRRLSYELTYFTEVKQDIVVGRDPTFQSQYEVAYLSETGRGEQAELVTELYARLLEAMADPEMHRVGAAPGPVRQDLANLPLYDGSGNFVHAPGFIYVPRPNANRVVDVHGAVHAASVAGSVPEIPHPASAGSLSSSQGTTPPGAVVRMTDSEFEFGFGSSGSEESYSQASLLYSVGGSVPATPVVGVAPLLDANSASWPMLEDAFRLTGDLEFVSSLRRAGEPLSEVPQGLDESYFTTDFGTFRRIDAAAADAPDEFRPRTGPSSAWQGGRSGTSSGQGGAGFGQAEFEGASPPGRQAGETSGFGRLEPPPADEFPFSYREDVVANLMRGRGLTEADIEILDLRFSTATATGEVDRSTRLWYAMAALVSDLKSQASLGGDLRGVYGGVQIVDWQALDALLRLFDTPRQGRPVRVPG